MHRVYIVSPRHTFVLMQNGDGLSRRIISLWLRLLHIDKTIIEERKSHFHNHLSQPKCDPYLWEPQCNCLCVNITRNHKVQVWTKMPTIWICLAMISLVSDIPLIEHHITLLGIYPCHVVQFVWHDYWFKWNAHSFGADVTLCPFVCIGHWSSQTPIVAGIINSPALWKLVHMFGNIGPQRTADTSVWLKKGDVLYNREPSKYFIIYLPKYYALRSVSRDFPVDFLVYSCFLHYPDFT